jgi:hypothetical protein
LKKSRHKKKQLMGVFCFLSRKKGRKALADIAAAAAAKTTIKTHTFPHLDNKQQTHTHTHNTERQIDTQEDKRR